MIVEMKAMTEKEFCEEFWKKQNKKAKLETKEWFLERLISDRERKKATISVWLDLNIGKIFETENTAYISEYLENTPTTDFENMLRDFFRMYIEIAKINGGIAVYERNVIIIQEQLNDMR